MNAPWTNLSADERMAWHVSRWRRGLPALVALAAAFVLAAPALGPAPFVPLLPLLCVIVWSLYQPRLMPPWAALLVGVATDLAMAMPLGVHATLMPLLALLLRASGDWFGARAFMLDWLAVGPLIAVYQLLALVLGGLIGAPRDPELLIAQTLLSWALFPAAARAAAWAQNRIGLD